MKNKVLLILATNDKYLKKKFAEDSSSPPLGLTSIASVLKIHGYKCEIIDLSVEFLSISEFKEKVLAYSPHLVGISSYTETYNSAINIAQLIKQILPNVEIVLGGPHVTFLPEEALSIKEVDFVIRNEGESTIIELMEYINNNSYPIHKIKGLAYKLNNDEIIVNEKRPYITNLDILPINTSKLISEDYNYKLTETIIGTRGCPGNCIFCSSRSMSGLRYRMRSAENIFNEIYYVYIKEGKDYFNIFDDTFTASRSRLKKFCDLMIQANIPVKWRCDSRADILSEDVLDLLKRAGCIAIHIGIESGSQEVLNKLGKGINLVKAENIISYANDIGIKVMCSFMIGHHCDTQNTVKQTISLALKFKRKYNAYIAFSTNTPFPGTYLYEHAKKLGITIHETRWDHFNLIEPVISTKYLSQEDLRNIIFEGQLETLKANR